MQTRTVDYLQEIAFVIFSQKKTFIVVSSCIFLAFLFYAITAPPVYMAQGSFFLKGKKVERSPDQMENMVLRSEATTQADLYSEVEMLVSDDVLREITLALAQQSLLGVQITGSQEEREKTVHKWISRIRGALLTEVVPKSNVIQVQVFWADPNDAKTLLETVMSQYLLYRDKLLNPAAKGVFFANRVDDYSNDLKNSKEAMIKLFKENGASDPMKEIELNLISRQTWQQRLQEAQVRFQENQKVLARLDSALDSNEVQLFSIVRNPTIELLSAGLLTLLTEQATVRKTFQPESVEVKVVDEHVQTAFNNLKREVLLYRDEVVDKIKTDEMQIAQLTEKINDLNQRNILLRTVDIENQQLLRENELISVSYKTFHQRKEEASLSKNLGPDTASINSYVVVLSKAKAQMDPVKPRRFFIVILGLFAALLLGFVSCLFNNYFDHTFKRQGDVETLLNLPLIFSISAVQSGQGKKSKPPFKKPAPAPTMKPTTAALAVILLLLSLAGGAWSKSGTAPHGLLASFSPFATPRSTQVTVVEPPKQDHTQPALIQPKGNVTPVSQSQDVPVPLSIMDGETDQSASKQSESASVETDMKEDTNGKNEENIPEQPQESEIVDDFETSDNIAQIIIYSVAHDQGPSALIDANDATTLATKNSNGNNGTLMHAKSNKKGHPTKTKFRSNNRNGSKAKQSGHDTLQKKWKQAQL